MDPGFFFAQSKRLRPFGAFDIIALSAIDAVKYVYIKWRPQC